MMRQPPRSTSVVLLAIGAAGLCGCDLRVGGPQRPVSSATSDAPATAPTGELGLVPRGAELPAAAPRASGRNPFTMASPARMTAPSEAERPTAPRVEEDIADIPPSVPLLTLIGIAERRDTSGVRRTAIVAGLGEVYLAAEGEAVTARYTVKSIGESLVELSERETGDVVRLALKSSR